MDKITVNTFIQERDLFRQSHSTYATRAKDILTCFVCY